MARYLVERLGFRTIAWEDSWASGVAIDRYVTGGDGDPATIVGDALFMLQTQAMVDLVAWMRQFNQNRPGHDHVRFLGADVLEVRPVQFVEIRGHVAEVAPDQRPALEADLAPIDWRGSPFGQLRWYRGLTPAEQHEVIAHARAVHDLVLGLPSHASTVSREDVLQHVHALLGFYVAYGPDGERTDARDRYATAIIDSWRRRTGHRVMYSAATAHTAAPSQRLLSFPHNRPGHDVRTCTPAGGLLRQQHGQDYVSIGVSFDHGQVLTGWEVRPGGPDVYDIPPPDPALVDDVLGQTRRPDHLLDLRHASPPAVRRWLAAPARMRLIASAYRPSDDAAYAITVDSLQASFDAILHLDQVTASRRLAPDPDPT